MKTDLSCYLRSGLAYSWDFSVVCRKSRAQTRLFQKEIMGTWCLAHRVHPYLTPEETDLLAQHTGLTKKQITNWVSNWRRRHWRKKDGKEEKEEEPAGLASGLLTSLGPLPSPRPLATSLSTSLSTPELISLDFTGFDNLPIGSGLPPVDWPETTDEVNT